MGEVKWTPEQLQAIETRGKTLLVSAGAGAGKTGVLVERVIRMATDRLNPVDINRMLVVTFTNAAAAEMRTRISTALNACLRENPGSELLARQLGLLDQASLTTLHSFCLDIVRRYFHVLDLDPAFRVGDEHELSLLRLDVLTDLFELQYHTPELVERFARLVDAYGGDKGDLGLQELVLRLYDFARSTPCPASWFTRALGFWNVQDIDSVDDLPWAEELCSIIRAEADGAKALLARAVHFAQMEDGPRVYLPVLESELEYVEALAAAGQSWTDLYRKFQRLEFFRLPACRGGEEVLKEQAKKLRAAAKKRLQRLADTYFNRRPEAWLQDMSRVYPVLRDLVQLAQEFGDAFSAAKRDRGIVDFNDLEHFCLRILSEERSGETVPSPVALELRDYFLQIMVDEYQDINGVQEMILSMVSRQDTESGNLFMVGDVKQSIYRFRLAEPDLFLQKYRSYPALTESSTEARLDLSLNFRSRLGIIDGVNYIFGQIMSAETAETEYDEASRLHYGAGYPPGPTGDPLDLDQVELHIIDQARSESTQPESEGMALEGDFSTPEAEAMLAASRINGLIHGGDGGAPYLVFDRKQQRYRPVRYSDIVILLRSTKGWANTFVEVFHGTGIPVYADLGSGYFAATEVETMISLLSVIDNPHQDIPVAGVLRSPMFKFTAADLAEIRTANPRGDFYSCVRASAELEGPRAQRLQGFLKQLRQWRTLARRKPVPALIWQVYRDTGYYEFVGGLPGGSQRQANLRALHSRARQYERTSYRGLFRFLRFIERVREKGDDLGTARPLGENEDVVRIMSVHRSKGLEFPITILAGLGKRFNFQDCYGDLLLHKCLGFAADVVDPVSRLRYPTLFKRLLAHRLEQEALAEEMRVLYVAMTRARDRLILMGSCKDLAQQIQTWYPAVPCGPTAPETAEVSGARSFLEWIGPAVAKHDDGGPLRAHSLPGAGQLYTVGDSSHWDVNIVDACGVAQSASSTPAASPEEDVISRIKACLPVEQPCNSAREVAARLDWSYPWKAETGRPAKLTATELKRKLDEPVAEDAVFIRPYGPRLHTRPRFMQEALALTAAETGTATHLVMQHIDLNAVLEDEVRRDIARLIANGIVSPEQAQVVDPASIARFLQSDLGQRVRCAVTVEREVPFVLCLPAERFYPDVGDDARPVLVQGVIDCLIGEDDGYVVVDYKTDRVPSGDDRKVGERYRSQLTLYADAVESITGRRIKEKFVYLFDTATIVPI